MLSILPNGIKKEESIMQVVVPITVNVDIDSPNLKEIINGFRDALNPCFQTVVLQVLNYFALKYMREGTLAKMLHSSKLTWKTSKGNEMTSIHTIFGKIQVPQLQVKDHERKGRRYITRLLLGIQPRVRIPHITVKMIGLMGSLATYRVVKKIASMFTTANFSLMSILRCIRKTAQEIDFSIQEQERNEFEADGSGLPVKKTGKRGKELKVLAQRKKTGGIRIAGMALGQYKKGWDKIFNPLKESLKKFKEIFLITDGDTSPLKGLRGINIILQRCLFHIPHETKYTLWEDGVKRKSEPWKYILSQVLDITNVRRIREEQGVAERFIQRKLKQFTLLIAYCRMNGYEHTAQYFSDAKGDLFSGIEKRVMGATLSYIERVMRTINMRINVAKWSGESALAVAKTLGAYYYNGFNV
jgi:hypothetical protein